MGAPATDLAGALGAITGRLESCAIRNGLWNAKSGSLVKADLLPHLVADVEFHISDKVSGRGLKWESLKSKMPTEAREWAGALLGIEQKERASA